MTPYSMQWNFNIQRELPGQIVLEVAYVGTRGLQLSRNDEGGLNLNQLDPKYMALGSQSESTVDNPFYGIVNNGVLASPRVSRAQLLRPYPQFTDIIPLYSSGASSNYHALQVTFSKRFSRGIQFEGTYTCEGHPQRHEPSEQLDIRQSRVLADYDIAQRFVVGYIFELPFGRGRAIGATGIAPVNAMLGGWQFNGFTNYQSGTPLSISASNVAGMFNSRQREQQRKKRKAVSGDIHDRLIKYFDTCVFQPAGNLHLRQHPPRRPDLRAPACATGIFRFQAVRTVAEYLRLQFRSEFLNAFNTVRFGAPNTERRIRIVRGDQLTSQLTAADSVRVEAPLVTECNKWRRSAKESGNSADPPIDSAFAWRASMTYRSSTS